MARQRLSTTDARFQDRFMAELLLRGLEEGNYAVVPEDRPRIERLLERLIDHLDALDGDCDHEDATDIEDEGLSPIGLGFVSGPGCPVSEPNELSWAERHSAYALSLPVQYDPKGTDDDEDSNDAEQDEDGI